MKSYTAVVTTKGEVVIPAELRRKYGIGAGTTLRFLEGYGRIEMRPLTEGYLRGLRGSLPGQKALDELAGMHAGEGKAG